MGYLITIDGLDGSGKHTQAQLLTKHLQDRGIAARLVCFPMYDSPSSTLVRMYLDGAFGADPNRVNGYAASSFYAIDRYATFLLDWKESYDRGDVIIADRYTTANAIHQLSKLAGEERAAFLKWLSDFEYERLGLPKPDITLFLEVPVERSLALIESRGNATDIHENRTHLKLAFDAAQYVCREWGWDRILCTRGKTLLSREEIQEEILAVLEKKAPFSCR